MGGRGSGSRRSTWPRARGLRCPRPTLSRPCTCHVRLWSKFSKGADNFPNCCVLSGGIEMYGLGNWAEIAEHVGTKMKAQCIDHYMTAYMHSPCHPLPDMSHINGKNRKDLLAMAKVQGLPLLGDIAPKEESPFSPTRVKIEDSNGEHPTGRSSSGLTAGVSKKGSSMGHLKDGSDATKVEGLVSDEGLPVDRSVGAKKPKYSGDEGSSMTKLSGYNPKREEFDPEYDNNAELSLAEMEFKENDSETEREIKLRVIRIYLSRLDERKRRKEFILERNLLNPNPLEKELSNEEKVLQRFKVFMRFLSQAEYKALVENAIEERRIRIKIQELQECRASGCRTLAEAEAFTEQKRKKEIAQKAKENCPVRGCPGRPPLSRESDVPITTPESHKTHGGGGGSSEITGTRSIVNSTSSFEEYWDITGLPGADLLSETEQQLCSENRLLPSHYLKMQEVLLQQILTGDVANSCDAHRLFKISPSKVDSVFNMVRKKLGHPIGSPNDND